MKEAWAASCMYEGRSGRAEGLGEKSGSAVPGDGGCLRRPFVDGAPPMYTWSGRAGMAWDVSETELEREHWRGAGLDRNSKLECFASPTERTTAEPEAGMDEDVGWKRKRWPVRARGRREGGRLAGSWMVVDGQPAPRHVFVAHSTLLGIAVAHTYHFVDPA